MRVRYLLPIVAALVVACLAATTSATPDTVNLKAGSNAVTWSGAAPNAISNFEGTPVTQVHRFDAVRQKWLSRTVGQDDATLPELHLLPRVQYLLVVDEAYKLTIPNPLPGIEPLAQLRFPPVPDDPLRFEAYWPNEDSPLEDLILLRSDDERLSVEAWVEGGVGEIEVYWALDGRLNHQGLKSDDVELLPGKHDNARLLAVDGRGQVAFAKLPRVVKLPQVEIPEMVYGVNAWGLTHPTEWVDSVWRYTSQEERAAVVHAISDIGFQFVRVSVQTGMLLDGPGLSWNAAHIDWLFDFMVNLGLEPLPIIGPSTGDAVRSTDVSIDRGWYLNGQEIRDANLAEILGRNAARRWPSVRFFDVSNEPNIKPYRADLDPIREVERQRATALGILYENPDAIIVAGTPCCFWADKWDWGINGLTFLEAMYEAGLVAWYDILGIHFSRGADDYANEVDQVRRMMAHYDDGDKPLWATETPASWQSEEQHTQHLLDHLRMGTERTEVNAVLIWTIRDYYHSGSERNSGLIERDFRDGRPVLQPSGIAVRDFLRSVVDD